MAAWKWCVWSAVSALLMTLTADAQEVGERVVISKGAVNEDLYVAGERVDVLTQVNGDVLAAGRQLVVSGPVRGDVLAVGGRIDIRSEVTDDVRAAGGTVTIEGRIGDEVAAAGGTVRLAPGAVVTGRAWFAGGEVDLAGSVGRDARIAGGAVAIAGSVQGNVEIMAQELRILPGARIDGNLVYRSPQEARISADAQILGTITYRPTEMPEQPGVMRTAGGFVLLLLSLLGSGIVLFLLLPRFTQGAARTIGTDPWKSVGLGLALLVVAPFVIMLLMVTLLGIPLALIALAAYLSALLVSAIVVMLFIGESGRRLAGRGPSATKAQGAVAFIVGFVVLAIAQFVPFARGLVWIATLLFGLGALGLQAYRTRTAAAAA